MFVDADALKVFIVVLTLKLHRLGPPYDVCWFLIVVLEQDECPC